jgi:hypothetical protein
MDLSLAPDDQGDLFHTRGRCDRRTIGSIGGGLALLLLKVDPAIDGIALFATLSAVKISLILLIKEMDDPFEVGKRIFAEVDLAVLLDLE